MITLNKLTKRFGPKVLFENVTLTFDPAKRYVIVGANGAGKSTLIKVLSGEVDADGGSFDISSKLKIGVLRQDHSTYDESRIIDTVLMGNKVLWEAMQEKERLLAGEMTDEVGMQLAELEGTIAEEDGYMAESRAAEMLEGVGIVTELHEQKMSSLASGWKPRVLVAQCLFAGADILILDEPTNHLDLDSIRWLENYLVNDFRGTLLVVSHDRHFMNSIATHVADVDFQTVTFFTGDYDDFVDQKTTGRRQSEADIAQKKKRITELKEFVARFGASANRSSQAQSRVKEIEKLSAGIVTKRSSVVRPYIKFEMNKPSGRDVLRAENLSKSFGEKKVFNDFSMNLNRGDKLAIIGPSGVGKSTLLKMVLSEYTTGEEAKVATEYTPNSGKVIWGHDTNVGYFAQDHHEALEPGYTCYEWLHRFDPNAPVEHVRSILGRLLFSGDQGLKKTETLSGGEAARMLLAKLILLKSNVILMDEPTNHLDVESIDALLQALTEFKGTVVVTSHDRHFVSKLGTRILAMLPGVEPNLFNGGYDEYLEKYSATEYLRKLGCSTTRRDCSRRDREDVRARA